MEMHSHPTNHRLSFSFSFGLLVMQIFFLENSGRPVFLLVKGSNSSPIKSWSSLREARFNRPSADSNEGWIAVTEKYRSTFLGFDMIGLIAAIFSKLANKVKSALLGDPIVRVSKAPGLILMDYGNWGVRNLNMPFVFREYPWNLVKCSCPMHAFSLS